MSPSADPQMKNIKSGKNDLLLPFVQQPDFVQRQPLPPSLIVETATLMALKLGRPKGERAGHPFESNCLMCLF